MLPPEVLEQVVPRGGPGWRMRRERLTRFVGCGFGAGLVVLGLWQGQGLAPSLGIAAFGLLLAGLAWPVRTGTAQPYPAEHDGAPATAIPTRPVPSRVIVLLAAVGTFVLVGGVVAGLRLLGEGQTARGYAAVVAGPVLGLVLLTLSLANLHPRARKPRPVLLAGDGVHWTWGGQPRVTAWEEVGTIEAWWTWSGLRWPRRRTNHILLRDRTGRPVVALPLTLLAVEPGEALRLMQERLKAEHR
ncbi:hypothetical protein [Georgenia deserti]|uniref:YcxB family protein n=1 Tax=Georgenia deserti TaxID=2093781 RepID=A0ABW4L3C7_9MICO